MQEQLEMQVLRGKKVLVRPLQVSDVTQRYVDWLNDSEVNHFLSIRDTHQDFEMVRQYVLSYEGVNNRFLLGIFDNTNNLHIGNITFSTVDWKNGTGVVGIAIGDKAYWRGGYATEALSLVIDFCFSKIKLHRLEAGISVNNLPSQKLFKKVGFVQEGILRDREKFGGDFVDVQIYGLVNNK